MKQTRRQKAMKKHETFRDMIHSIEFLAFAKQHGDDAVIPVVGMSMNEIQAEYKKAYDAI